MLTSLLRTHRVLISSLFQRTKYTNPTLLSQSYYHPQVIFYFRNLLYNKKNWKKLFYSSKKYTVLASYYSTQTTAPTEGNTTSEQQTENKTSEEPPPPLPPELQAKREFRTFFTSFLMSSQQKASDLCADDDSIVWCRRLDLVYEELSMSVNWVQIQELANEGIQTARELLAHEIVQHPAHSSLRADLHYIEGTCLCKLRQFAEAETAFLNSFNSDKDYFPALLGVAEASHAREMWFQALCYYTTFIDRCVDYYRAVTTIDRKMWSIEVLSSARCKRAMVYLQLPDLQLAQTDAQCVVELGDPKWTARAFLILAQVSGMRGNWTDQVEFCTLAMERVASLLYEKKTEEDKTVRTVNPVIAGILSQAHHMRSLAFEVLNKPTEAAEDRQRATQLMHLRVWYANITDSEGFMGVPRLPVPSMPIPLHLLKFSE